MPRRITGPFHVAARAFVVPFVPVGAPEGQGELVEQAFMDSIFARRNLVRFVFVAITAVLCLEAVLA